jgi:multidrug efflux pump subunit AcrB
MWLVRAALRSRYTIAVMAIVILVMASLSARRMSADVLPNIDIPVVVVVWSYAGLSAEDMERRIVLVSERAYSSSVGGISRIESRSISGVGMLKIYFEPHANVGSAIAQISSMSQTITRLMPVGTFPPTVLQYNASNVPVAPRLARPGVRRRRTRAPRRQPDAPRGNGAHRRHRVRRRHQQ